MVKARQFALIEKAEIRVPTTPAGVREILLSIAQCAYWNSMNAEPGSPETAMDQLIISQELEAAVYKIKNRISEHRKGKHDH